MAKPLVNVILALVCLIADTDAVVYYLREDKLLSQTIITDDGHVLNATNPTEVRNNNGTMRAFDIDYNRQLIYWIDNQNKVPLTIPVVNVSPQ